MKPEKHSVLIRLPKELWRIYAQAALNSDKTTTDLILDALEARRNFVEKKYIGA